MQVEESLIESGNCEKLLDIKIDSKLTFDKDINAVFKITSNKIRTLARPYLTWLLRIKKILMNSFFDSQFNYCSFVWMFHSRKDNTMINNVHEWCLQLIYSDKRMDRFLFITVISRYFQPKYTKSKMTCFVKQKWIRTI